MRPPVSVTDFLFDEQMLGGQRNFGKPTWGNWKVLLKGMFAEPMTPREQYTFWELAERAPPNVPVREAWLCIGRRAGKDSVASGIATYMAAMCDFRPYLRSGEVPLIVCLAVDRTQSRIVFDYIAGYFTDVPLLRPLVKRMAPSEGVIELRNGTEIQVATNNFRAIRGRTIALAVMDEVGYWLTDSDDTTNTDQEVYTSLRPGCITLRPAGSMIIGISTPYRRSGLLYEKYRTHYGQDDDEVLVVKQPSLVFHDSDEVRKEYASLNEYDPERAAAEYMSEWRSDLADFVDRSVIESLVPYGCYELPYVPRFSHVAFCDPSGGSSDAMTLAVAHSENGKAVLDCLREIRAPFNPSDACAEFAKVLKSYHITRVTGDRYSGMWVVEGFAEVGIIYEHSERTKIDIYREVLPLLMRGGCTLLDNPRLVAQFCGLERRTARGGRDSIDHKPGAHDDLANAAAGCLVSVAGDDRSAVVRRYLLGKWAA
jgi:hypothetical protein